jgi:hypothetical protein
MPQTLNNPHSSFLSRTRFVRFRTRFVQPYRVTCETDRKTKPNHEKISVCSVGSCSCFPASIAIRDSLLTIHGTRFVTFVNFCKISLPSVVSVPSSVFCHPSSETAIRYSPLTIRRSSAAHRLPGPHVPQPDRRALHPQFHGFQHRHFIPDR